jgi:hypothetical protein
MINAIIIENVENVFLILVDNCSSPPFSLGALLERDVAELFVVVAATVTDVVATVGNGAIDVVLAIDTDAAVDTDADVAIVAFVVVVTDGAFVVVVTDGAFVVVVTDGAFVVVVTDGAFVVVVGFNTQIRFVLRLPLNEMYSLLSHCFQFVQLVPLN